MESITVERDDSNSCAVFFITDLSEGVKTLIRENLQSICHGVKVGPGFNYANTLKEFLERYESKSEKIKMGMIGELLTHIIFVSQYKGMLHASMFFNMEERSIKKGFDVVLYETESQEIWLTEVKSGSGADKVAKTKNSELLQTAKRDMHDKLSSANTMLWHNAINGAMLSVEKKQIKAEIIEILNTALTGTQGSIAEEYKKNVILVSVLYKSLDERFTIQNVVDVRNSVEAEKKFSKLLVVSFQKATYKKVVDFLKLECT